MKTFLKSILLSLPFLFFACEKDSTTNQTIKKELFSGYVQKGPYINGSSVIISELDANLDQTGRSYNSTISDNSGKFVKKNIELVSHFIELKADGFYFNEVKGENSSAQLSLYAIADVSGENTSNVNILTHLEKSRTEYLVTEKDMNFSDAKKQAQKEVLAIFSIEKDDIGNSEVLTLSGEGDNNAILCAVSAIVQGYRSTADMSELLANIISDIKTDGVLNDSALGSLLINDAKLLKAENIKQNLITRYNELGISAAVPDFEKYIKMFIENSKYKPTKTIEYPKKSNYGINVLNDSVTAVDFYMNWDMKYSMSAILPAGTSLKIVLKGGLWSYRAMPNGPVNFFISDYANEYQEFTAIESGKTCDVAMQFVDNDTITIEYYENGSAIATKIKQLLPPIPPVQK